MRVVFNTGILIAALITKYTSPDLIYQAWRKKNSSRQRPSGSWRNSVASAAIRSLTEHGQVRDFLKNPWRDGSTHVILEPLEFIARLAAPVSKTRVNLTRFIGWL